MPARPSWQRHLRLSLVTCPVALYPATSEAETVHFNLINIKSNDVEFWLGAAAMVIAGWLLARWLSERDRDK